MLRRASGKNSYRSRVRTGARSKNPQIYTRTSTISPERNFSKFYGFIFILIIGFFIYAALLSPALTIKNIKVSGGFEGSIKKVVSKETGKNFITRNILFFNARKIKKELLKNLRIKDATIKKSYPNTLEIKSVKREPRLIWEENEKFFLVDGEGLAFFEIEGEREAYQGLPIIKNNLISLSKVGDKVASEEFMDFTEFLINNFENEIADKIILIEINTSHTEITVLTDKNYKIFFDVTKSVANQIKSLKRVKEEIKASSKRLEYIDLRIDTRVFYK